MQTLPAEQLAAFLQEAKNSGVYELYYLDLATGLRRGELLGLKWEDIDLDQGVIRVRRQVARINGKVQEMPLKTKNAHRRPHLAGQCAEYAAQGTAAGRTAAPSVPRSQTYVRDLGPAERRGHQNRLRDAGPLLCGLYAGHLCPCHNSRAERGGKYYGEYPDAKLSRIRRTKNAGGAAPPVWFCCWSLFYSCCWSKWLNCSVQYSAKTGISFLATSHTMSISTAP